MSGSGLLPDVWKPYVEKLESRVAELEAFRAAVIGWRENDHPEWFCRKTAEYVAELGKGARR
jgi:hypothetical protein